MKVCFFGGWDSHQEPSIEIIFEKDKFDNLISLLNLDS